MDGDKPHTHVCTKRLYVCHSRIQILFQIFFHDSNHMQNVKHFTRSAGKVRMSGLSLESRQSQSFTGNIHTCTYFNPSKHATAPALFVLTSKAPAPSSPSFRNPTYQSPSTATLPGRKARMSIYLRRTRVSSWLRRQNGAPRPRNRTASPLRCNRGTGVCALSYV